MKKICLITLIVSIAHTPLARPEIYENLKELGPDNLVWRTCNNHGKARFFQSEIETLCTFLDNNLAEISKSGCSQKSLGLGFKGALKHFHEQDKETKILIAEIREAYLNCERHAGNEKIKDAINTILKDTSDDIKHNELSKFHKIGNHLAEKYGEYLKKEKPEQLKREKEQKEIERNRF